MRVMRLMSSKAKEYFFWLPSMNSVCTNSSIVMTVAWQQLMAAKSRMFLQGMTKTLGIWGSWEGTWGYPKAAVL